MDAALRVETASGEARENPSADLLFDLLSEMNLRHRFVIVDRMDVEPAGQHYMQVYLNDNMSCQVEFREGGSDRHFAARVAGPFDMSGHEIVAKVLQGGAFGASGWRESLPWSRVEVQNQP
jgi:hypothetical protein